MSSVGTLHSLLVVLATQQLHILLLFLLLLLLLRLQSYRIPAESPTRLNLEGAYRVPADSPTRLNLGFNDSGGGGDSVGDGGGLPRRFIQREWELL